MTDQPTPPAPPQAGTVQLGAGSTASGVLFVTLWNSVLAAHGAVESMTPEVATVVVPAVAAIAHYLASWLPRPKRKEQADG